MINQYLVEEFGIIDNELTTAWLQLWEKSPYANCCNNLQWTQAYLDAMPRATLHVYACYRDGEIVGILPLVTSHHFMIPVLAFAGREHLLKSSLLLLDSDSEVLARLMASAAKKHSLYFNEITPEYNHLYRSNTPRWNHYQASVCPGRALEGSPEQWMPSSQRRSLQNRIKKHQHETRIVFVDKDHEQYFDAIYAIEQSSHKGAKAQNIFTTATVRKFFEQTVKRDPEHALFVIMYVKDTPVGFMIGYTYQQTYLCMQTAYDEKYADYMPGKTIVLALLEEMQRRNFNYVDMGRGNHGYKLQFADRTIAQYAWTYSGSALIRWYWDSMRWIYGIAADRLPEPTTRFVRLAKKYLSMLF